MHYASLQLAPAASAAPRYAVNWKAWLAIVFFKFFHLKLSLSFSFLEIFFNFLFYLFGINSGQ
jgi:hypothetical protein